MKLSTWDKIAQINKLKIFNWTLILSKLDKEVQKLKVLQDGIGCDRDPIHILLSFVSFGEGIGTVRSPT